MRDKLTFLLLGGALMMAGYFLGDSDAGVPAANAQEYIQRDDIRYMRHGETIITQSEDGLTLHFWSTNDHDERIFRPVRYITSIERDDNQ